MATKIKNLQEVLLQSSPIGLDSMCFIYQFSQDLRFSPLTNLVFELMEKKKIIAVTSTISVIETFVLPERHGDQFLISEYENVFLNMPGLTIVSIDWAVSRLTARLRAHYPTIRLPDLLQISASLLQGCNAFVTNDQQLKQVKEIQIISFNDFL